MPTNTRTWSCSDNLSISHSVPFAKTQDHQYIAHASTFTSFIILAVLSPVAVVLNALILAAIWKKPFQRTPFHVLLSGLAITDLCTGLIAQPFTAANNWSYSINSTLATDRPAIFITIEAISSASTSYFITLTSLITTLMSIERWLHMSHMRTTLVTWRRGCFTAILLSLLPIPNAVLIALQRVENLRWHEFEIVIVAEMVLCFLITLVAYVKVLRIIRRHQQRVQGNASSQNFAHPAINLAKYKKSVKTILYILALLCLCFFPFIISFGVYVHVGENSGTAVALTISSVLIFLSSSLNPCLYVWRMKDVRNGVKELFCNNN